MANDIPLASPQAMKTHVVERFAAAADGYDVDGTEFFGQVGARLVQAADFAAGAWVLDVGCGKGAVSLPAARAAGPDGHVTGIDLAAPMLSYARDRARGVGLSNVNFREGDAEDPGAWPGWPPNSFDVVLAANVIQFLPRPARAARNWLGLLTPDGTLGVAWTLGQDPRWAAVIGAIDAHVPDGVPAFGAFMRRRPFTDVGAFEAMLTQAGYLKVTTVTHQISISYNGPEQWWATYQTQGPWALSWRHIPADRLTAAKWQAFELLEPLRATGGFLTRTLTFAITTARKGTA